MTTYQQQKQEVLNLFERAIAFAKSHKSTQTLKHLLKAQKHLVEGKLFVVVCGEFKQGKSSLLNAFLNETSLFPVDIDITTNLVSTITYGQTEKITVVLGEPGKEKVKPIKRVEIPDYVTEQRNAKNTKQARMLIIESPNPQLKEGLVLVDTPGIGSLNAEHTSMTYTFIPNADAILFITDALKPLTTEEISFLKEKILPHCQNLIFVVTKADTVSDAQQIVANNREKLAQVLNSEPEKITIIPVSSRAKLDYLEYEEPEDLKYSNFPELESQIWQLVSAQRGQTFLLRAVNELAQSVGEMKAPLQVAWEVYQERTQEELDALETEIQQTKTRLISQLDKNADWQSQLSYDLQNIRKHLSFEFDKGFMAIEDNYSKYLNDNRLLDSPRQIASLLEADIDALITNLQKQLSQKAAEVYSHTESVLGLTLNKIGVDQFQWNKNKFSDNVEVEIKRSGWFKKSIAVVQKGKFSVPIGTGIAAVVGGLAGIAIGTLLGGPAGTYFGADIGVKLGGALGGIKTAKDAVEEGLSQLKEKEKREVSQLILPFIKKCQLNCKQTLEDMLTNLEQSIKKELRSQIKRQKEGWEQTLHSLQQSRKLSEAEAAKRTQELQVPLQQLTELQNSIEQLTQAIVEQPITQAPLETQIQAETSQPTSVKSPQHIASVATSTSSDYGDWADE